MKRTKVPRLSVKQSILENAKQLFQGSAPAMETEGVALIFLPLTKTYIEDVGLLCRYASIISLLLLLLLH